MSTVNDKYRQMLNEHAEAINAALVNEQVTRVRVEEIERVLGRGFFGRLKWLIKGR